MYAIGCDVSRYNVSFNPDLASGVIDFAIQKATQGYSYVDLKYEEIWQGVSKVSVRGAYHYLQAGLSWLAQADHFLETAAKHDYHIHALDVEEVGNVYNDTFFADAKRVIDRWRVVSDKKAVLYTNGWTYDQMYFALLRLYGNAGVTWLEDTPLWIASPGIAGAPVLPKYRLNKEWVIHQYSWNGLPSRWGTGGTRVDENVFHGDAALLHSWLGLSGEPTTPPQEGPITMQGTVKNTVTRSLNVRDPNGNVIAALRYDFATLKGDVVYGDVKADNRIYFTRIYRSNGVVQNLGVLCSAVTKDGTAVYMDLANVPEPGTEPPPLDPAHEIVVDIDVTATLDGVTYRGTMAGLKLVAE